MNKISKDQRLELYLGDKEFGSTPPKDEGIRFDAPFLFRDGIESRQNYDRDILRYMSYAKEKDIWFQCGDGSYLGTPYPVLVKVRDRTHPSANGVLANLNSWRHWTLGFADCEWEQKKWDWIWRGSDTGHERIKFIELYNKQYDAGFSQLVGKSKFDPERYKKETGEYLKPIISPTQMLQYKYLPVIDGNDKSSSLNWVLFSNSVPILACPRYHSWLCESYLEPYVHYVPMRDDFTDLLVQIEWCREHDAECKQIAQNGREFIMNFLDPEVELDIERSLINEVIRITNNN